MTKAIPKNRTGPWRFADLKKIKRHGLKVFSCFHCGGGSTMGYKLAGFDVIGGVEIDPRMMAIYRKNHQPKHSFEMGVAEFNEQIAKRVPPELKGIDVLDGSPPCSVFSMAGNREKDWGKARKFKEGQKDQVLDDLFFHFIHTAELLKPKIVIAENVRGMLIGNARWYVKEIFDRFRAAKYDVQLFLLNSVNMGVPQTRQRVFFIARRQDLNLPKIALEFKEPEIPCSEAWKDLPIEAPAELNLKPNSKMLTYWHKVMPGSSFEKATKGGTNFTNYRLPWSRPSVTLTSASTMSHPKLPRKLTDLEICRLQTFPDDYDFDGEQAQYVCGMSVPPFMMQRIAREVAGQLLLR